jgi:hypothetical protein
VASHLLEHCNLQMHQQLEFLAKDLTTKVEYLRHLEEKKDHL